MATENRKSPLIPRPPKPKNTVEFIVEVFIIIVTSFLMGSIITVFLLIAFRPETDVGPLINVLADIMTTLIGALIGYMAGKGSSRIDVEEEVARLKKEETDESS
jgi:hypothetical protein